MILISHIIISTTSLIITGLAYFYPSNLKLRIAYATVALTLLSGFYLVLSKPANLTQTCVEGLIYLGVVSFGIVSARHKLNRRIIE